MKRNFMNKTRHFNASEVRRNCYLIDANNKVLGRIATKAAAILRGKHKTMFTPNIDCGDVVVIINAEKVRVTGKKMTDKLYQRYTGYPGGQKIFKLEEIMAKRPTEVLRLAITRMIPKGPLGNRVKTKLKIYTGEKHPHQAQKPITLAV